jgi:hypothetical protein
MELYFAGRDELGRQAHLAFIPELTAIGHLAFPGVFVVLIAGRTIDLSVDGIYSVAEVLLERGAAYIMCWGEGASRCEDIIDEAVAMKTLDDPTAPTIMTTAHENESIEEVLKFATTAAVPADEFANCRDVVLVFHDNVNWYNEACIHLENMLNDGAA